jgi:hypothetical protein
MPRLTRMRNETGIYRVMLQGINQLQLLTPCQLMQRLGAVDGLPGMKACDQPATAWQRRHRYASEHRRLLRGTENIKAQIKSAQYRAALGANREQILLYWHIGKVIIDNSSYGKSFVKTSSVTSSLSSLAPRAIPFVTCSMCVSSPSAYLCCFNRPRAV